MKKRRKIIIIVSIVLLVVLTAAAAAALAPKTKEPAYSDIVGYFESGDVSGYTLNIESGLLAAELRDGGKITYTVPDVKLFIGQIEPVVSAYNAAHPDGKITYDYTKSWQNAQWLSSLPYIVLFAAGTALILGRRGVRKRGAVTVSKKAGVESGSTVDGRKTFADVAGADEEKEELREIVEFLKNPAKFNSLGARIPKGVLLVGPPGTGKTLIAKAVSGEAGVPFFPLSGSDFVEMYVGVGASRVRDLFERAKKVAPCIVFIDEIDAVGRRRGTGLRGGNDEREQTLNQLLVEMDGFGTNAGVIVVAATNRADILDPALLRPGRFDRQVFVGMPDIEGRKAVLKVHARSKPISSEVDFEEVARATAGFTGADLENLLNEAALLAARRGKDVVEVADIEESVMKVVAGPEKKSKVISAKEKRLTAYHEAGHALVTVCLPSQKQVQQISIIPRGRMGGYTLVPPDEDRNFETKKDMLEQICILLGGRVAESLALDDISTGASNDIERATEIARLMVTKFGMSERLGPMAFDAENDLSCGNSDRMASEIDEEILKIINSANEKAEKLLTDHINSLHAVADYLCRNEKMSGTELERILNGGAVPA